jgi:hypothetical protein
MPYDPAHVDHETHIRSLIRRGAINFEAVVAELEANHFIDDGHDEMPMTRPGFNGFDPQEFDALFAFFYPGKGTSMKVFPYGVPMGASGDFVWALYDAETITRLELTDMVRAKYTST